MKPPIFKIHLGQTTADAKISCNGVSIAHLISEIKIIQKAGHALHLELTVAPFTSEVDLEAAINAKVTPPAVPKLNRPYPKTESRPQNFGWIKKVFRQLKFPPVKRDL